MEPDYTRLQKTFRVRLDRKAKRAEDDRRLLEWAKAVKERSGHRCEVCGSKQAVEAHHIVSRRYKATRYDVTNGVALCQKHHQDATWHLLRIWGWDDKGFLMWERVAI